MNEKMKLQAELQENALNNPLEDFSDAARERFESLSQAEQEYALLYNGYYLPQTEEELDRVMEGRGSIEAKKMGCFLRNEVIMKIMDNCPDIWNSRNSLESCDYVESKLDNFSTSDFLTYKEVFENLPSDFDERAEIFRGFVYDVADKIGVRDYENIAVNKDRLKEGGEASAGWRNASRKIMINVSDSRVMQKDESLDLAGSLAHEVFHANQAGIADALRSKEAEGAWFLQDYDEYDGDWDDEEREKHDTKRLMQEFYLSAKVARKWLAGEYEPGSDEERAAKYCTAWYGYVDIDSEIEKVENKIYSDDYEAYLNNLLESEAFVFGDSMERIMRLSGERYGFGLENQEKYNETFQSLDSQHDEIMKYAINDYEIMTLVKGDLEDLMNATYFMFGGDSGKYEKALRNELEEVRNNTEDPIRRAADSLLIILKHQGYACSEEATREGIRTGLLSFGALEAGLEEFKDLNNPENQEDDDFDWEDEREGIASLVFKNDLCLRPKKYTEVDYYDYIEQRLHLIEAKMAEDDD